MATTINRALARTVREELVEAAKAIAEKHGLQVGTQHRATYGTDISVKVQFISEDLDENGVNLADPKVLDYQTLCYRYGLPTDGVGKSFKASDGNTYTIVGLAPKSYKRPVLARREDNGKTYKFPAESIVRMQTLGWLK